MSASKGSWTGLHYARSLWGHQVKEKPEGLGRKPQGTQMLKLHYGPNSQKCVDLGVCKMFDLSAVNKRS